MAFVVWLRCIICRNRKFCKGLRKLEWVCGRGGGYADSKSNIVCRAGRCYWFCQWQVLKNSFENRVQG